MADQIEESTKENTQSIDGQQQGDSQEAILPPPKKSKKGASFLTYFTCLISLAALSLSAWLFYQNTLKQYDHQFEELISSQKLLDSRLLAQRNTFSEIEPVITQITPTLNKLEQVSQFAQENTSRLSSDVSILQQKFKRLESTTKEDWKLAEAEYLIRLANQRLLMEKDLIGAIQMLANADEILEQLSDPLLFNARRTLAKDIHNLKSTPSFDLEGIYLQLEALTTLAQGLPQKGHNHSQIPQTNEESIVQKEHKTLLTELWSTLKSLVIINYHNQPITPLLPPLEYQQLVLDIQLQINVAQLALLKQESTIYHTALDHVYQTINVYFDLDSLSINNFLTSLTALQQITPSPELPLPRDSLVAIKEASSLWHNTSQTIKKETEQ